MNTPSRRPLVEADELGTFVTTVTIADGTDNQHKSIIRLVRDNLADLEEFGRVGFQNAPFVTNGGRQTREIAQLNEQQATLLLTYMRNNDQVRIFKKNLVRAFYDMAQQLNNQRSPMSEDDIVAQALQITSNRVRALEAKVALDAPKVDYHDTFIADEDLITLRTVASDLKIAESALRQLLVDKRWIYRQSTTRWSESEQRTVKVNRYSAMADKKDYFQAVLNHDAPRFKGEVMHTLKITPKGATAIARLVKGMRRDAGILAEERGEQYVF